MTKSFRSTLSRESPGGFTSKDELRKLFKMIAGYILIGGLSERMADHAFDRLVRNRRTNVDASPGRDPITERMHILLDGHCSDTDIRTGAKCFYERRREDTWGRWRASYRSKWHVRTEVMGLEHVDRALERGSGVVFWGMSFCGTLFSKIALSRAGVALTQLSSADHGASDPLTWLGKRVVGPMHCLPERRYICERIRIPMDGDNSYLRRIGEVLRNNGCVWIAGERNRAKKLVSAELFNRVGRFPVGAPLLALRHKATLLPAYTQRLGRFHYRVTVEPPILLNRNTRSSEIIDQAVQDYTHRLADRILQNPGDWDWAYSWAKNLVANRWKVGAEID
jgi:lauroyl/myristoyl acyltransferase